MPTVVPNAEPIFSRLIEQAGYRLVRLRMTGSKSQTLQVMAERADGTMQVEDCAVISDILTTFLETEDPIGGDYVLEVSSPGIDRPLTRLDDFARWAGFDARVELTAPQDGKKRFKAVVSGVEGEVVVFAVGATTIRVAFDAIAEAKLILTDKLIAADLAARQPAVPPAAPSKNSRHNARNPRATGD